MRALLRFRGERVDRIDIHAAVAASPRTRTPAARTGNRAGIIVVKLPLGEPDPAVRLRLISANSNNAKHEQQLTTAQGLMLWLARLGLLRRFTRRQRLTTIVESNVTGPPAPIVGWRAEEVTTAANTAISVTHDQSPTGGGRWEIGGSTNYYRWYYEVVPR